MATSWGNATGEKFYKGSKADNAWNHDLLWKVRVKSENNAMGLKAAMNIPTHAQYKLPQQDSIDQLQSARSVRSRPSTSHSRYSSNRTDIPDEIAKVERELRQEIKRRQAIERKLQRLLEVIVENEPEWLKMEEKRKKRTQSRQVLSKVSQAVAQYKTQRS